MVSLTLLLILLGEPIPPPDVMVRYDEPPPLEDLHRFPSPSDTEECLSFARGVIEHWRMRYETEKHRRNELGVALSEAVEIKQAWKRLASAQSEYKLDRDRRYELLLLRNIIGEEAYASGTMPPPAPYWWFAFKD